MLIRRGVLITIVVISLILISLYLRSPSPPEYKESESFPTIELTLIDSPAGDSISIKILKGELVDWSKYLIYIENIDNKNESGKLYPKSLKGNDIIFNSSNAIGFDDFDIKKNSTYLVEIYYVQKMKCEWQREIFVY